MTNTQKQQIEDVLNGFDFRLMQRLVWRASKYKQDKTPESLRETARELLETVIEHKAKIGFLGFFFAVNTDEILELHSTLNHSHVLKENYAKLGAKKVKTYDDVFGDFLMALLEGRV